MNGRVNFALMLILFAFTCTGIEAVKADTLVLKDGQQIKGKLVGRTEDGIKFEMSGQVLQFKNENIKSVDMDFGGNKPAPTPAKAQSAAQPPPPKATGAVTIPAGSVLRVKNKTMLHTNRTSQGDPFVVTLDSAVIIGGKEVLSPGTKISGRVTEAIRGGRLARRAKMVIELTEIELPGKKIPIRTELYGVMGERQGTLRKVAIGAAIGSIDSGSSGAEKGAAYGGVAGAATSGKQVAVPPGTLIEFKLASPVTF